MFIIYQKYASSDIIKKYKLHNQRRVEMSKKMTDRNTKSEILKEYNDVLAKLKQKD